MVSRWEATGMKIPKEVILDLLQIYLAGEASPATRAWVEEYLSRDPELAQQFRREALKDFGQGLPLPVAPELELRTLKRTRRMIGLLRWSFGWGVAFTLGALALKISFSPFRLHFLMFDYPAELGSCLAVGMAFWILCFVLRARLRAR
jgi:hypothetical protein